VGWAIALKSSLRSDSIPWQLFSKIVLSYVLFMTAALTLCAIGTRVYFKSHILTQGFQIDPSIADHTLKIFDTSLAFLVSTTLILLSVAASAVAKNFVFPLGRVLMKAKVVLNRETSDQPRSSRPLRQAFGQSLGQALGQAIRQESVREWSDLESSFEEMRRSLESKIQNLKTEREEQATLMSAISDAILAVDQEEAPLFYNSRFALLFGNQKLHTHQRLRELFKDPEILDAFQNALKNGKTSSVKAIPIDDKSDRGFFSLSVSPLRQAENLIYGAVGVFHDVTELKRAEQIRIDFVANVSHELRTPLTAIKGYADTLLFDSKQGNPVMPEFLDVIVRNADRLMNLINDLLDLSSLESKDTLQKTKISTEEVTSRILKQMTGAFESKGHTVTVTNDAPLVLADPRRLEQVLVNLLDNANKYTPAEGKIWIQWEPASDKGTLLTVRNSGPGIPPEHHSRLFERFYRVDKARSREQGGTGLGLAIVKHIMQRHDGSVWVDSKVGKGTAFICRFPE